MSDCSCPRGGGWRPGARWAENSKERVKRADLQARIDAMPAHQRPPMRELGRRSEAAEVVFRRQRCALPASSPALAAGKEEPLVTTHRSGQRVTLAAVSPEAAALGLQQGMALTQARALVPGLAVRDADPGGDAALLERLALFAARRWTPTAAISGPDGLFLDLSGVAHLFGGERAMCRRILGFCARLGFAARIAVAATPGAAHALARHGGEAIALCPSGSQAEALAPLPVAALRVDETVAGAARRLGIERIGDLLAMPRAPLQRRFGKTLLARLDQALGAAAEPFDPVVPLDPPSAACRLVEPIATAEAIATALRMLMGELIATLEAQGLAARALTLHCLRVDGVEQRAGIGTARATRDAVHLLRLLCARIETIDPGFGIEAMRLVAVGAEPLGPRPIEGELAGDRPAPDIVPLIDRLAGRLGGQGLFRLSALESDVPERSLRRSGPLEPVTGWPRWPRPVRLLVPPERVDNVVALLPDQPPRRFTWRGKVHRVARADGPERIHGEWWRATDEAYAVRDYFQVEDDEGRRFWLYRRGDGVDPRTGDLSWRLQGMFA